MVLVRESLATLRFAWENRLFREGPGYQTTPNQPLLLSIPFWKPNEDEYSFYYSANG
jgi:hypothetical protein